MSGIQPDPCSKLQIWSSRFFDELRVPIDGSRNEFLPIWYASWTNLVASELLQRLSLAVFPHGTPFR